MAMVVNLKPIFCQEMDLHLSKSNQLFIGLSSSLSSFFGKLPLVGMKISITQNLQTDQLEIGDEHDSVGGRHD